MKVEMVPVHGKNPGINIHGSQVTPLVWDIFDYSIQANRLDCPWYEARKKAGAFFQGGSFSSADKWVFIEFWHPFRADEYLNLINSALAYVTDDGTPKPIKVSTSDTDLLKWLDSLVNFYGVSIVGVGGNEWLIEYTDPLMLTSIVEKSLQNPGVFSPIN